MEPTKSNFRKHTEERSLLYAKKGLIRKGKASSKAENILIFEYKRGQLTNNGASPWWIEVQIGTSSAPQTFKLMTDTGTIDTWITARSCSTSECLLHDSFNESNSTSFSWIDQNIDIINFGPWGTMDVNLGNDNWLAIDRDGINQSAQIDFWMGQNYSGNRFNELIQDGFLAVGPSGDASRSNLLFDTLWYAGALAAPYMSYWVDYSIGGSVTDSGQLIFGGSNTSVYNPDYIITLSIEDDIYWTHIGNSISVGGVDVITEPSFIMDTGASEIKGESAEIASIISAVTLNGELPESPEDPSMYPYPDLTIRLGVDPEGSIGTLTFSPSAYFNYIENGVDTGKWQLALTVLEGLGPNTFTFGTNLLDTLYSEWEYDVSGTSVKAKEIRIAHRV